MLCSLALPVLLLCTVAATRLDKRQAVASQACAAQPVTQGICSPASTDVWYNGSYHEFTWNYNNAAYTAQDTIDLYLLYENNTGQYEQLKLWANLPRTQGVLVQLIDDSWYPSQLPDNSANKTWKPYAYVLSPGRNYQEEIDKLATSETYFPAPVQFTLIQNAHNTTNTTAANPSSEVGDKDTSSGLKPWMIGVIVAACVVFLALCGAVFWLFRKMRRNKAMSAGGAETAGAGTAAASAGALASLAAAGTSEKGSQPNVVTDNRDISSIHSSTPMVMHSGSQRSSPVRDKAGALMQHAEARQSSSILSSTDALMIADTFRQFMRKPEWTEHHEEEDDGLQSQWESKQQQQQQQRGDEMLRRQLAEDGTPLQQVQKRSSPLKNDDAP
ncbi:hypothetical protein BCR43DRAFT_497956 [Syncephalastrum racemosum]|uniref:Mid2 domain-containing protein n=1 Tax=Syncephalastrum racemosum TaxID=13706 RepID=A0A1X2H374_SYNRA|nr:hypothetical protein BCR43DRAFT_497956 [Syncephalastrum racemosum]